VEQSEGYTDLNISRDPLTLLRKVQLTHRVEVTVDEDSAAYKSDQVYQAIRQGEHESLRSYYSRFKSLLSDAKATGNKYPDERQGLHFFNRLDRGRYGECIRSYENRENKDDKIKKLTYPIRNEEIEAGCAIA
jgi:hypothetical protein